jgi:membrane protease YdiL (CAAX protease family)
VAINPSAAWAEILLCSGYPTQLVIAAALLASGLRPVNDGQSLSPSFFFALSLIDTLVLLTLILVLLIRRGERPTEVFVGRRPAAGEVAFGVLSAPLVLTVVVAMMAGLLRLAPQLHNVAKNPLENLLTTGAGIWMFLFVAIVAGGVREELQRAFLLHRFKAGLGRPWTGLLITSLSFGLGHTIQGNDAAIMTGTLGALWGAMSLVRGGAIASIVSHSLFNSVELLRVLVR